MSYIQHSLSDSEILLYKARFPWFYYASAWAALIVLGIFGVFAYARMEAWLTAPLIAVGLALFLGAMVPIWTTEIGVTNQRLIYKRGLLWRTTQELQLRAIEEVKLTQGLLGRLFNFGRLELHGTGVGDIALPSLADPVGLRKALQDGMTAAAQQGAAGAGPRMETAPPDTSRSAA
jgi:uncharacterized membrane protein YdbT with pleckstrin-like domain